MLVRPQNVRLFNAASLYAKDISILYFRGKKTKFCFDEGKNTVNVFHTALFSFSYIVLTEKKVSIQFSYTTVLIVSASNSKSNSLSFF